MAYSSSNSSQRGSALFVIAIVIVILVVTGGCIWLVLSRRPTAAQQGRLTAEAEAYFPNMSMTDFDMKATESFAQQQLVEITGKISNKGSRFVESVDAVCLFYDVSGQQAHRERVSLIKPREGPLKPGETRPFRMAFDAIPPTWNQVFPQIAIAEMKFAK